jgi:hypothetical protein
LISFVLARTVESASVKEVIHHFTLQEAQELAAASLHTTSGREVLAMLNALLQRIDPGLLG